MASILNEEKGKKWKVEHWFVRWGMVANAEVRVVFSERQSVSLGITDMTIVKVC